MDNLFEKSWFWIIFVGVVVAGLILVIGIGDDPIDEDAAIRVNDQVISQQELDQYISQVSQEFQMYGMQIGEEEAKREAVQRAIQEALLRDYLDERDFEIDEEEVDRQYEELMTMYGAQTEEEFLAQMEMQGLSTRSEIEDILRFELKIEKLIDSYEEEVDEVTDDELQEAYDDYAARMEAMEGFEEMDQEVPTFEEMESDLRENLLQQRITPLILTRLDDLEEDADIEFFIDFEYEDLEVEEEGIDLDFDEDDAEDVIELEVEDEEIDMEVEDEEVEDAIELEIDPEDLE